jgi:Holliday junction resolvase RusA-like endonuclease
MPRMGGRGYYLGDAALRFHSLMKSVLNSKGIGSVEAKRHRVIIAIFLGRKQKGDIDNFAKVALDSLVRCEVLRSDATVEVLLMTKSRDKENPRTEFTIEAI